MITFWNVFVSWILFSKRLRLFSMIISCFKLYELIFVKTISLNWWKNNKNDEIWLSFDWHILTYDVFLITWYFDELNDNCCFFANLCYILNIFCWNQCFHDFTIFQYFDISLIFWRNIRNSNTIWKQKFFLFQQKHALFQNNLSIDKRLQYLMKLNN